jgi:hypothetical protein
VVAITVCKPAAPFEGDGGRGDDPLEQASALRALGDLRIGEFLDFFSVAFARLAFVLIERHILLPISSLTYLGLSRDGGHATRGARRFDSTLPPQGPTARGKHDDQ